MTQIKLLTTPWQRAWGAMFRRSLGETVLVFVYPHPAERSFHTYFCPPLRIMALDDPQADLIAHNVGHRLIERGVSADIVVQALRRFDETCVRLTQGQNADMDFETPDFIIDESGLLLGVKALTEMSLDYLDQ